MGRAPCCDKSTVKKGPWSPEEDSILKNFIHQHGTGGNWIALPHKAGLRRCGKSCRLRWLNYLRPDIKHGEFSDEEDRIICNLFSTIGSRWSIIAAQLPGRTDNDIKNYWNTKLKKKLNTGIPPIPFSDRRIRQKCGASPPPPHPVHPPHPATTATHSPFLLSISSPLTTLFSSSTRMAHNNPTLYMQNQGVSCSCNTFPFSDTTTVLPVGSYVGGGEREGRWWEAPLEYGLEEVKQMIIDGGVEGDENKAAEEEGRGYL